MNKVTKSKNALKEIRLDISKNKTRFDIPVLVESQLEAYKKFLEKDLVEMFRSISPVVDVTGKLWSLEILDPVFKQPKHDVVKARRNGLTYSAPLYWKFRLVNLQTGEAKEQQVFIGDVPLMTDRGTFVINGDERAVVFQIVRSEGVIFLHNGLFYNGLPLYLAKIIPQRGAWFTIDISKTGVMSIKLGPKRSKINMCTLLRALGYNSNDDILNLFRDVKFNPNQVNIIEATLAKDPTNSTPAAIFDIYNRMRPDVTASLESAKQYIESLLFDPQRTYLGDVGRYQFNKKLNEKYKRELNEDNYKFFASDLIGIIERLLDVNYGNQMPDDTDHLGNRRIRRVNELLGEVVYAAIKRLERSIKEKMSIHSSDELLMPADILNPTLIVTAFKSFFGTSPLSRFMSQKNVLSELSNLRYITVGGPGGLTSESATMSVRDVHYSQYGRFCVAETPEGLNIGLINHLALFARINDYGFIEVPYRKVFKVAKIEESLNRILAEDLNIGEDTISKGTFIDESVFDQIQKVSKPTIMVKPYISSEIVYLDADLEKDYKFSDANVRTDEYGNILDEVVPIRTWNNFYDGSVYEIDYVDVDPTSSAGVVFSLLPLGNHTAVDRNQIAVSNMKQAMPLVYPEAPIVGTGLEDDICRLSGRAIYSDLDGTVKYVDSRRIVISGKSGEKTYYLDKFQSSNDNTLIHQRPTVNLGQKVNKGDLIADFASSQDGEIAVGTNVLAACMYFDGLDFEDGYVVSDRLVKNHKLASVIIKTYTFDVRQTKLGPEQITRDIPGVSEELLAKLNEDGIVRIGAKVKAGDILVGCIAPKGEVELTPEEKLLRAIFGESAYDVMDVSLRVPHGEYGVVIDTIVLDRNTDELPNGVLKQVRVKVAHLHEVNIGDKLCDRGGQKGVIPKIIPESDMPHLADGTPIDIIFNPLFLKRLNFVVVKEMSLSLKAEALNTKFAIHPFTEPDEEELDRLLGENGFDIKDKCILYDGRTGEAYPNPIAVGYKYLLKVTHIAEEKIHARSTGSYTVITQQPLGGKAQFGGQRFGEMEVWALEAHGVPTVLQEMLTVKSDDVIGRDRVYEAIIHGKEIKIDGIPESFRVFINELKALGLNPGIYDDHNEEIKLTLNRSSHTDSRSQQKEQNSSNVKIEQIEQENK